MKPILANFFPLLELEEKLLDCAQRGISTPECHAPPSGAIEKNRIRADFLRFLLLGEDASSAVHQRGIILCGAWVEGVLDLHSANIKSGLKLTCCHFQEIPNFDNSEIDGSMEIENCSMPGIKASHISVKGNLLVVGSTIDGCIFLENAHIQGNYACVESKVHGAETTAMAAIGLAVDGGVFLDKSTFDGKIELYRTRIGDGLSAKFSSLNGKDNISMVAGGAEVGGTVVFEGAKILGEVRLLAIRVGGDIDFENAELTSQGSSSLSCDRAVVEGNVRLCDGFKAKGAVRIPGARILGDVYLDGAVINGIGGSAFNAENALVEGDLRFSFGFASTGAIELSGIRVKRNLNLHEANFQNDKEVFVANGIVVDNILSVVRLKTPLTNASFQSSKVGVLIDDEISWGNNIFLDGFVYGAFAGLAPINATSRIKWIDKQPAENCGASETVFFKPQPWRQLRKILFEMGHIEDARQVSIEYEVRIRKAGLIGQSPNSRNKLAAWLNRITSLLAHRVFGILIGYGYRPARLVAWLCTVWLVCGALYWAAALQGVMAPSNPLVFQDPRYQNCLSDKSGGWYLCPNLPEEYTGFSPLAYSMDVLLPFVDLQQEKDWAPKVPTPNSTWYLELSEVTLKHFVRMVLWFEIIFGWIAGVLLVAVVSGLTKRTVD